MMMQAQLPIPEPTETVQDRRSTKRLLGIYRYAWCKSCAAQTCHTYQGEHHWTCDICGTERVDRHLWITRPRLERLRGW